MESTKQPYELLGRWKPDGTISGLHIQYAIVTRDNDGKLLTHTPLDPEPLALGSFPLADVLSEVQASVLADNVRLKSDADAAQAAHEASMQEFSEAKNKECAELKASLDSAQETITERDAAIKAMQEGMEKLDKELEDLTKQHDACQGNLDTAQSLVSDLTTAKTTLETEVEKLKIQLESAATLASEAQVAYQTKLDGLTAELEVFRNPPVVELSDEERIQAAVDKQLKSLLFQAEVQRRVDAQMAILNPPTPTEAPSPAPVSETPAPLQVSDEVQAMASTTNTATPEPTNPAPEAA